MIEIGDIEKKASLNISPQQSRIVSLFVAAAITASLRFIAKSSFQSSLIKGLAAGGISFGFLSLISTKSTLFLYRNDLENQLLPRRHPDFKPGEAGAEPTQNEKLSDADGLKSSGCPTPVKTDSSDHLGTNKNDSENQQSLPSLNSNNEVLISEGIAEELPLVKEANSKEEEVDQTSTYSDVASSSCASSSYASTSTQKTPPRSPFEQALEVLKFTPFQEELKPKNQTTIYDSKKNIYSSFSDFDCNFLFITNAGFVIDIRETIFRCKRGSYHTQHKIDDPNDPYLSERELIVDSPEKLDALISLEQHFLGTTELENHKARLTEIKKEILTSSFIHPSGWRTQVEKLNLVGLEEPTTPLKESTVDNLSALSQYLEFAGIGGNANDLKSIYLNEFNGYLEAMKKSDLDEFLKIASMNIWKMVSTISLSDRGAHLYGEKGLQLGFLHWFKNVRAGNTCVNDEFRPRMSRLFGGLNLVHITSEERQPDFTQVHYFDIE